MIDKNTAEDILSAALAGGADFAEIFTERSRKKSITLINGIAERAGSGIDFGLGLRIFVGDKTLYSYTNDLRRDNLLSFAKELASAVKGDSHVIPSELIRCDYSENDKHPAKIDPIGISQKAVSDILKAASDAAFAEDSLITQTSLSYIAKCREICVINSEGTWAEDRQVRVRFSVNAVASKGTEKQSGYFGPGSHSGFEFIENLDTAGFAREAARSAVTMLKADECPAGRMPVVIENGFGGVIFHEACGHGLEASAIAKNASVFAGRIGERIASEKVTAIDDGTIANSWGSSNVDDEGIPSQKNILIENGILKNYMTDRFNGKKINMSATGSSRRESYKFIPVSRMTNTYIAAGKDKAADIISSVDYGLYAKRMGGGSVNPASGEFNFAVNEAYIIRNGKIAEPVRSATLIGKGSEILEKIDMVSDNLRLSEGMCGASSGSLPVCVGQPMIRVSDITVGGRG